MNHWLKFFIVVCATGTTCFTVKTCAELPPREDPSLTCTKVGGRYHQYTYDAYGRQIDAFCSMVEK